MRVGKSLQRLHWLLSSLDMWVIVLHLNQMSSSMRVHMNNKLRCPRLMRCSMRAHPGQPLPHVILR